MRTIKLTLEYVGTRYCGWERQPAGTSVRGTLEEVLGAITGGPVNLTAAGRTDAGVHAAANVASFTTSSRKSLARIAWSANGMLPGDISITDAEEASPGFDARRDALWREYEYLALNRPQRSALLAERAHFVARPLDDRAMARALAHLVGRHDFRAFCAKVAHLDGRSTIRTVIEAECVRRGDLVAIKLRADAFLHNMVRIIAGTAILIGQGRADPDEMELILISGDRQSAAATAPACGLTLMAVGYPEQGESS